MMRVFRASLPGLQYQLFASIVGAVLGWSEHIPYEQRRRNGSQIRRAPIMVFE